MGMKAVFFDIDGTLMDSDMVIPKSVYIALSKLKEQGHLAFICTGRTKVNALDPRLVEMGFDGMISGCGTMVEYRGEELLYYCIPGDAALYTVETLRECSFDMMLEGRDYLYVYEDIFDLKSQPESMQRNLEGKLASIEEYYGRWEFSKLICKTDPKKADRQTAISRLSDLYTFQSHNEWMVEMVPKQFSKGTGINTVREHLGISKEDTFCFGDSINDIEMLSAAGTGIVMGNGESAAKEAADYVTDTVSKDGIYNALKHFGLTGD